MSHNSDHISMMKEVQEAQSMTDRELCNKLDQYQQYQEHSHRSILDVSARLEDSQSRIERQLKELLASDRRRSSRLVSRSLDASSPEGRGTWMMLGRLLRDEGITPKDIKAHKDKLVLAMKNAMAPLSQEGASLSSYHTATEGSYATRQDNVDFAACQITTLSSKPREGSYFPPSIADRAHGIPGAWTEDDNVEKGMRSLLDGMDDLEEDQDKSNLDGLAFGDLEGQTMEDHAFEESTALNSVTTASKSVQPLQHQQAMPQRVLDRQLRDPTWRVKSEAWPGLYMLMKH